MTDDEKKRLAEFVIQLDERLDDQSKLQFLILRLLIELQKMQNKAGNAAMFIGQIEQQIIKSGQTIESNRQRRQRLREDLNFG